MKIHTGSSETTFDLALQNALNEAIKASTNQEITYTVTKISGTYSRNSGENKSIDVEISVSDITENIN